MQEWSFTKFPDNVHSKASNNTINTEYILEHPTVSLLRCTALCGQQDDCNSVFLNQDTCYGSFSLTPGSLKNSSILPFIKRPVDGTTAYIDDGFLYYRGMCLYISDVGKTWNEAKLFCEQKGSHLIVLDSENKTDEFVDFMRTYQQAYIFEYFVGASDIETEGQWKWISSGAQNYFKWNRLQPNNRDKMTNDDYKDADCAAINTEKAGLIDEACLQDKYFVCEK